VSIADLGSNGGISYRYLIRDKRSFLPCLDFKSPASLQTAFGRLKFLSGLSNLSPIRLQDVGYRNL
jgi:hypothetical protein